MTAETLKKFKDTLERVDTVAIKLGKSFDAARLLAGAILHSAFAKLGKKSSYEPGPLKENAENFLKILLGEPAPNSRAENMLIRIDTKKTPVSGLRYEKEEDALKIILSGKGVLNPEGVRVEKEPASVDLLMLVDPEEKELEDIASSLPHKEVVRLNAQTGALCGKTGDLLESLFGEIPKEYAEAMYLLTELESSSVAEKTKEKLRMQEKLLGILPDREKIARAKESLWGRGFWKLLGRALSRSEFEAPSSILWTCVTQNDFEKTGSAEKVLPAIFHELKLLRPEVKFFSLLWERKGDSKSVSALIGSGNSRSLQTLASSMGSSLSSPYFLSHGYKSFSEAEIKIRSHVSNGVK